MSKTMALATDANAATERLSTAMAAKRDLMVAAATGKPVRADELRAAEESVRAAELDATLASEVAKFTIAERQRATITQFQDRAATLASLTADLARKHVEAARALDAAMVAARAAAEELDAARLALVGADAAAHQHNALLDAESRSNAVLNVQHRSAWPKARTVGPLPTTFGRALRPELVVFNPAPSPLAGTGGRDEVVRQTAEQLALGAHPLTLVASKAA
jgi:hypothetical protein